MWRSKDYWSTIREMGRPSIDTLLEAIDDEMRGDKHYSEQEETYAYKGLKEQLDMVDRLSHEMAILGVDYSNMSVQEAEQAYQKASEEYMAAENADVDEAEEERSAVFPLNDDGRIFYLRVYALFCLL